MSYAIYIIALLVALLHGTDSSGAVPAARTTRLALCRVLSGTHKPSGEGTFDFSVARSRHGLTASYVNVVADLNGDGVIDSYDVNEKTQDEWIVQNVPLPMGGDNAQRPEYSIWFKFPDLSVKQGESRTVAVILTDGPIDLAASQRVEDLVAWDIEALSVRTTGWGADDERGQRLMSHASSPSRSRTSGDTLLTTTGAGTSVPDLPQLSNECGPTSVANSLLWLGERYGFLGRLPQTSFGTPDTNKLILDLMESMAGTSERPFKGLKGNQMFSGKRDYIKDHDLPIKVDGGSSDPQARGGAAFDFIVKHLSQREPAELLIWMPDGEGHWVTVTGYARQGNRALLFVHDPDDKKEATAIWELSIGRKGKPDGDLKLPGKCSLGWAVSGVPVNAPLQAAAKKTAGGGGSPSLLRQMQNSNGATTDDQPMVFSVDVD